MKQLIPWEKSVKDWHAAEFSHDQAPATSQPISYQSEFQVFFSSNYSRKYYLGELISKIEVSIFHSDEMGASDQLKPFLFIGKWGLCSCWGSISRRSGTTAAVAMMKERNPCGTSFEKETSARKYKGRGEKPATAVGHDRVSGNHDITQTGLEG